LVEVVACQTVVVGMLAAVECLIFGAAVAVLERAVQAVHLGVGVADPDGIVVVVSRQRESAEEHLEGVPELDRKSLHAWDYRARLG